MVEKWLTLWSSKLPDFPHQQKPLMSYLFRFEKDSGAIVGKSFVVICFV
jgi:hypothetical protein